MRATNRSELPAEYRCLLCGDLKPIAEMMLVHHAGGGFHLRPRCKKCQNLRERGHRRQQKARYLRAWRARNQDLDQSYWRIANEQKRPEIARRAAVRFQAHHAGILIQGRLWRRLKLKVTLAEAETLCEKYGRCYPTRQGLTPRGLRECEQIRSRLRRRPGPPAWGPVEIRMMVYADSRWNFIKPRLQAAPYQKSAETLRAWWRKKKSAGEPGAPSNQATGD